MPYSCALLPIDLGGFFSSTPPSLSGMFTPITGSPPPSAATPNPASPFLVSFPTATPPPPGAVSLHITDGTSAGGDIFRSGAVTTLPPMPGTLTAVTVPPTATMLPTATLVTGAAALTPIILAPPTWMIAVATAATGGAFMPLIGAVTTIVPTLTAGALTLTVTGFFTGRAWFVALTTFTFSGTVTLAVRPSGDALNRGRVLGVTATSSALSATGFGAFLSLLGPFLGGVVAPLLESVVNSRITSLIGPAITALGFIQSPTSVLSARRVVIAPSGLALQLVLADLLGPAISAPAPVLDQFKIAVAPTPKAGVPLTYTVTITDVLTGAPVPGAKVELHNYLPIGLATHQAQTTNAQGEVVFSVTLEFRVLEAEIRGRDVVRRLSPTLRVSKAGYSTLTRSLL